MDRVTVVSVVIAIGVFVAMIVVSLLASVR